MLIMILLYSCLEEMNILIQASLRKGFYAGWVSILVQFAEQLMVTGLDVLEFGQSGPHHRYF